jgi:hypothetical protein
MFIHRDGLDVETEKLNMQPNLVTSLASPATRSMANLVALTPPVTQPVVQTLERQFAQRVAELGLNNPATARALGDMAEVALRSGQSQAQVQTALRQAVRSTGGEAGERTFVQLLGKLGGRAMPGLNIVLLAFDVAQAMDAGAAGGGRLLQTEARMAAQGAMRQVLQNGDPRHQLLGLMAGAPGALLEMARATAQFAQPSNRAALLRGLPTIAKLARGGVQEAEQVLRTLAKAKDPGLREAAQAALRGGSPANGTTPAQDRPSVQQRQPTLAQPKPKPVPVTVPPVALQEPRLPSLMPPLTQSLPPLRNPKQEALDRANQLAQATQKQQQAFLGRLQEQAKGSAVANAATLAGWVRSETPQRLQERIGEMQEVLKGASLGNVYASHVYANGTKPKEASDRRHNQYTYGGALLTGADLQYLQKGLKQYLAQLAQLESRSQAEQTAQAPLTGYGARVETPGKTLAGEAARKREAELMEQGRQRALEILKTLRPAPLSSQSYEDLLKEAIGQADPYTAFWLASLGRSIQPGPGLATAPNSEAVLSSADVNRWRRDPNGAQAEIAAVVARQPNLLSLAALADRLGKDLQALPGVQEAFVQRLTTLQDALRGGPKWDSKTLARQTYRMLTETAVGQTNVAKQGMLERLSQRPDLVDYVLENARRFATPQAAERFLGTMEAIFANRPTNNAGTTRPHALFGGSTVPQIFPEHLRPVLDAYMNGQVVIGSDHKAHVYGDSVRKLDLRGKSAQALDAELKAKGFVRHDDQLRDPRTQEQLGVPMTVYVHPDGGMVRIKPQGDPTSPIRPQPHGSKAVRWPVDGAYTSFDQEAFKIDAVGNPRPKFPPHLQIGAEGASKPNRFGYLDKSMDDVHVDLPAQNGPR